MAETEATQAEMTRKENNIMDYELNDGGWDKVKGVGAGTSINISDDIQLARGVELAPTHRDLWQGWEASVSERTAESALAVPGRR